MRTLAALVAGLLCLGIGACGDDGTYDRAGGAPPAGDRGDDLPDRAPDLVGTVTSVEPFVPVTDDCVPAEDLPPDAATSSDDPATCTPDDNDVVGTVVVEEQPGVQAGRKISYTVTGDTVMTGEIGGGGAVGAFADLAEGQAVESWVAEGFCAESYPEQCGAEAIRVTTEAG